MHEDILNYISDARGYGLKDDAIKQHLLDAGWEAGEITEAFALEDEKQIPFKAIEIKGSTLEQSVKKSQPLDEKPSKNKAWRYSIFVLLALLGFAALFYFVIFQNTRVLGFSAFEFLANSSIKHSQDANIKEVEISYTDPESFNSGNLGNGLNGIVLKNLHAKIQNENFRDILNAREGKTSLNFQNDNSSYSTSLEYKYINEEFYFKLDENTQQPLLSSLLNGFIGSDISGKWLRIKVSNAKEQIENRVGLNNLIQTLLSSNVITPKLKGIDNINGRYAFHYSINLNKEELKKLLDDQLPVNDSAPSQMVSNSQKEGVDAFIDHLDIHNVDVWFGVRDFAVKKFYMNANLPSLASLAEQILKNYTMELAKSNDNNRIADIRQMSSALELFYNDNKGYPEGITGVPQNLVPKYLPAIPTTAPATGNCADYYNTYWYKHQGEPKISAKGFKVYPSYTLTFCLGFDTANFKAGFGMATPSGITTTVACPDQVHPCFLDHSRQSTNPESIGALLSKVKYTGQFSWTYVPQMSKDNRTVKAPEDAIEFGQPIIPVTPTQ